MRKYIIILFIICSTNFIYSQCEVFNKLTPSQWFFEKNRSIELKPRADWQCEVKVIQLNFHFIQKSNGTRGLRADDDGYGYAGYTGYDFAHNVIENLNRTLLDNEKMHIPPGNNTLVLDKNYKFVVKGVYFHQNDAAWNDPSSFPITLRNTTAANQMQEFDMFIHTSDDAIKPNSLAPGIGGGASSVLSTPGDKYIVSNEYATYEYYKTHKFHNQWTNPQDYWLTNQQNADLLSQATGLMNHELCHLLTLSHTVTYNWKGFCPTIIDNGFVDDSCDDHCWDTPTAWYMRDVLKAPRHPGNVLGTPVQEWLTWGSNNRMEYSGHSALTPIQLKRIHSSLEDINLLRGYLLCERVKTDVNICSFNPNNTLYAGKNVTINKNCTGTLTVPIRRYVKVAYNDNNNAEIFNNFEVKNGGYFEIMSSCVCN